MKKYAYTLEELVQLQEDVKHPSRFDNVEDSFVDDGVKEEGVNYGYVDDDGVFNIVLSSPAKY